MTTLELYHQCKCFLKSPFPAGMGEVPEATSIVGKGFFPVASGSCHDWDVRLPVRRKVMFIGQDWGCESDLELVRADKDADIKFTTGKNLLKLIDAAGLPLDECFFTNALLGVREGKANTGSSPGWKSDSFVLHCKEALELQIREIRPKAVVCLGRHVPDLLVKIMAECQKWRRAKSFVTIDTAGYALIHVEPPYGSVTTLAILVHPSFRHINVKRRSFETSRGSDAEVALLKAVWAKVRKES